MKKLVIMAALALSSVGAFAQQAVGTWSVTPKVGMNIANITKGDGDARIGLVAGGEFEYQATDMISITAGALYSMQGSKASDDGVKATLKLDYINVPIFKILIIIQKKKLYQLHHQNAQIVIQLKIPHVAGHTPMVKK